MRHQVLLIHEKQATRDGLVDALDNEGFIGIPAASGQQALDHLQRGGHAGVILLDEQAGWTAFRRAQRDPALASIPVIAITPLRGSSATYGARDPIDVGLLIAIVRRLCDSSPARAACSKTQAAASVLRQLEEDGGKNGLSAGCETLPRGQAFGLRKNGGAIC
jgi:DNA-binding response OmpR family regulator